MPSTAGRSQARAQRDRAGPVRRSRVIGLAAGVIALTGAFTISTLRSSGAAPRAGGPAPSVFVALGGHDGGGCGGVRTPCATLGGAYRAAAPGTVVEIRSGTYPQQTIGGEGAKGSRRRITFRPAPGARVRFAGTIFEFASHIVLEHLAVQDVTVGNYDQTEGRPNPTDVRLLELAGRNFQIDSATDVTVEGGSWGPASACGGPYGGTNNSIRDITGVVPAKILIDSVRIHDIQSDDLTQCHIEGLAIFAGQGIVVSHSRFYGNSVYDVFVQPNSGPISDLSFRENWMAMPVGTDGAENGTVIGFSGISSNVALVDNRFNYIVSLDDDGLNPVFSHFTLRGNVGVLPYGGCSLRGISWEGNLWGDGACSRTDVSLHGRPLPYRDRSNGAALDYRLTGATPARWRRIQAHP
jgi:hypothetical protein